MNLDKILKSLRNIGLTKPENEMVLITDEPKIPGYLCFTNEEAREKYNTENVFGQGFDTNRIKAKIKSTGECLERLCLDNPLEEKFLVSKYKNNEWFIDPGLFCCYSSNQLQNKEKFLEGSKKAKYAWFPIKDLINEKEFLIPAQIVFISNIFDDEFVIRNERISTGAALGSISDRYALKNGFLEVIERDACISDYLLKKEIPKIVDIPNELQDLIDYLQRYQLEPYIFDVTTDLEIPSVLVITLDRTRYGSAVNVGSKSKFDYGGAIKGALLESIQCRRSSRVMKKFQFPDKLPNENEIFSMDHRFYYWSSLDRINDLDFWLNTENKVSYNKLIKKNINFNKAIATLSHKNYH